MRSELPGDVRLREATPDDEPDVRRLLAASGLPADEAPLSGRRMYAAHAGDTVVGLVGVEPIGVDVLLQVTCVDADWRGRGVGSALVEHALTEAALDAMDSVLTLPGPAAGFFARFGFIAVHDTDVPSHMLRAFIRDLGKPPGGTAMQLKLTVS